MQNVALAWLVLELSDSPSPSARSRSGASSRSPCSGSSPASYRTGSSRASSSWRRRRARWRSRSRSPSSRSRAPRRLPIVYLLAALGGVTLAFDAPGRQSLTFQMVGPRELPNAVALNSGLFNGSRVIGPAIAGLLIAAVGTGLCFVLNAFSFLAVLAALALVRADELHVRSSATRPPASSMACGGRSRSRGTTRAPPRPRRRHGREHRRLQLPRPRAAARRRHAPRRAGGLRAALSASFGLGALVGALATATFREASWRLFAIGGGRFGVLALLLLPCRTPCSPGCSLFGIGVSFTLFTANANALVQLAAPDHLRGRLIAVYLFAFVGVARRRALRRLARRPRRHVARLRSRRRDLAGVDRRRARVETRPPLPSAPRA